jgi:hypothetical protein
LDIPSSITHSNFYERDARKEGWSTSNHFLSPIDRKSSWRGQSKSTYNLWFYTQAKSDWGGIFDYCITRSLMYSNLWPYVYIRGLCIACRRILQTYARSSLPFFREVRRPCSQPCSWIPASGSHIDSVSPNILFRLTFRACPRLGITCMLNSRKDVSSWLCGPF